VGELEHEADDCEHCDASARRAGFLLRRWLGILRLASAEQLHLCMLLFAIYAHAGTSRSWQEIKSRTTSTTFHIYCFQRQKLLATSMI
jgi:hypothetical protein